MFSNNIDTEYLSEVCDRKGATFVVFSLLTKKAKAVVEIRERLSL